MTGTNTKLVELYQSKRTMRDKNLIHEAGTGEFEALPLRQKFAPANFSIP